MGKLLAAALAFACLMPASGAMAQVPTLNLVNQGRHGIVALSVAPASSENWGPDVLGAGVVGSGRSARIALPRESAQCSFDLRITYETGEVTQLHGVDLCQSRSITVSNDDEEDEVLTG